MALAGILLLAGCEKTEISVYHVPKEAPWKLPAGWQEREAGGMRAARFSAPSASGSDLDISIFPIRGFGGNQVEILNIWRQQLKLEPVVSDADVKQIAEKTVIGNVEAELYDMTSGDNLLEGKAKARSLVAAARKDGTMWFVKMTGDDAGVGQQKAAFVSFLKDINLKYIVPPSIPAMDPQAAGANPHGEGDGHDHGTASNKQDAHPEWVVPTGWAEQPPSQFLNAKFVVTGEAGQKVEVNVSVSPGDGGGLAANINRWRGQVGLATWDEATMEKGVTTFDAVGAKATLVDFKGTDARSGQPARLIGVVVPVQGRTWFYKMMGDEQVADREKAALIKFVGSAKHPND